MYWDSVAGKAVIEPGVPYTGEAPKADPSTDAIAGSGELEDGTYFIKASKNKNFVVDVPNSSKNDGTKLIIFTKTGNDNQKFKITNVGGNNYSIQCVHSGKWWTSNGTKGAVITQSGSAKDNNVTIFTIIKQADGTYRIMDSKGFYVGVSGAQMKNSTYIILWTEASDKSQNYIFEAAK